MWNEQSAEFGNKSTSGAAPEPHYGPHANEDRHPHAGTGHFKENCIIAGILCGFCSCYDYVVNVHG